MVLPRQHHLLAAPPPALCCCCCLPLRVLCDGQPCLPVGTSDLPGTSTVKIFCPKCEDIYYPRIDYQVGCLYVRVRTDTHVGQQGSSQDRHLFGMDDCSEESRT